MIAKIATAHAAVSAAIGTAADTSGVVLAFHLDGIVAIVIAIAVAIHLSVTLGLFISKHHQNRTKTHTHQYMGGHSITHRH